MCPYFPMSAAKADFIQVMFFSTQKTDVNICSKIKNVKINHVIFKILWGCNEGTKFSSFLFTEKI